MEYRPLGRTGVQVSKLCLGTMMFGAWGNTDHDDSIRIIHRALDAGVNFVDTADVYSDGESEEIVGKALAGSRRDDVVLATKFWGADGRRPEPRRRLAALDRRGGRALAAAARHGLDRPLPDASPRARRRTSTRPSERSPTSSSRARFATSARPRSPEARSSRRSGSRASGTSSASAPSSRRTRCSSAASRSTSCRPRSDTAWASSPTARWPAGGCRAAGARTPRRRRRPGSGWPRGSTCRWPRTSASSKRSSSSRRSPTTRDSRSSSSRSPSSSTTPR